MRGCLPVRELVQLIALSLVITMDGEAANAATYVLAIGINEYDHEQQLAGAQQDAEDIALTFGRLGAEVTLLRNREASREHIEKEWRALLARARTGDTVILSYAGHGGQE